MRPVLLFSIFTIMVSANRLAPMETICLQPEEKKLYNLLMDYRKSKNLEGIPLSAKLSRVAQVHAKDLSENFDSQGGKCNIHSWSKKGKWKPCCYTSDHKEASCMWNKPREISGYESNGFEISYYSSAGASATEGVAIWKSSAGHNRVIINEGTWANSKWKAIGIGIYKDYGVVWFGMLEDTETIVDCP